LNKKVAGNVLFTSNQIAMKRPVISKIRISAGIITLFTILGIADCSKSDTMNDNTGDGGNKGGPGENEVWI